MPASASCRRNPGKLLLDAGCPIQVQCRPEENRERRGRHDHAVVPARVEAQLIGVATG